MDNPILPLTERAHNQTPRGIAQLLEQTLLSPNHIGDGTDLAVDQGCWAPEPQTQGENGPSSGAATGAVFSSGTLWGTLHPVVQNQAISATIVPLFRKRAPVRLGLIIAVYELVQINLQVSQRAAA